MEMSTAYLLGRLMFALDREAERLLQDQVGVSYKRILFLTVLRDCGTVTQHELAVALGYSDPAVSVMLGELTKDGLVATAPSATHGRKRLVSITPKGAEVVTRGRRVLDTSFDELLVRAEVDGQRLRESAARLYQAVLAKGKQGNA
ncbi:MAG TPA: MarR family transcriptional regulator [Ktedonobacterales bacterium]|jgi:DNA-binding MarR family transcriptional regulator|nr:MarR family transcriptional regulator [Ktedonobacterales bacterium]